MPSNSWTWLVGTTALALLGCEMKDADRCPDPWVYIKEIRVCCPQNYVYDGEHDSCICKAGLVPGEDGITCEKAPPPSTEATDTPGTDTTPTCASGLGTPCLDKETSTDCAGFCESFCAWNPVASTGYCTTQGCTDGTCAEDYKCCDCAESTVLPQVSACLQSPDASLAGSLGGCTCEK